MNIWLQQESVANLRKARALYVQRQQEYEKAKDVALKAENDSLAMSSSGTKADKKRKHEEDAMHRVSVIGTYATTITIYY